jgi:hypothetical protein
MRRAAALLVLAACGEVNSDSPDAATAAIDAAPALDGTDVDPPDAAPMATDWGAPVPLDFSAAETTERSPTVTGDGLELTFVRRRPSDRFPAMWTTRRERVGAPWGTPVQIDVGGSYGDPDVSADGLQLVYMRMSSVYNGRREVRMGDWTSFELVATGSSPTLQEDGLTVYLNSASNGIRDLRRSSLASTSWTDYGAAPFAYPAPDGAIYRSFDVRGDLAVFSNPSSAEMPAVATMEIERTGLWGNFRALPSLADGAVSECDVVSKTELICGYDSDGDGTADDIAQVTRTLAP